MSLLEIPVDRLEVAHAIECRKRLIPLVSGEIDETLVPKELRALNWIFNKGPADLAATSKQAVHDWALSERIDIATTRATYLLKMWRLELAAERAKRSTEQELMTEQTRLGRAWEKHLDGKG
jgi:hypothetical protein